MAELKMEPWESALFERTKEFVDKTCPNLKRAQRIHTIAAIYDQMRRTLLVVGHE